jgi:putative intracellular protease/amidase
MSQSMSQSIKQKSGRSILSLLAVVVAACHVSTPIAANPPTQSPISVQERAETLLALNPQQKARPVVVVVGANAGTETTDFLIPLGVLTRADIGEVMSLGTTAGPMVLMPALRIIPNATLADFDASHPTGADYVIVPAVHNSNDPVLVNWIKSQQAKGAIIIGICSGAKVLGSAGLLEGRRATTHWFDLKGVRKAHPTMIHVANRRFLVDRGVATTTGVSASIPMSLTLVEAIAGSQRADAIARELGVANWDARHDSGAFKASGGFYSVAAANILSFWGHEKVGLRVEPGVDEVALALTADAWSRTYRSQAQTVSLTNSELLTRSGIGLLADHVGAPSNLKFVSSPIGAAQPAKALDVALGDIARRYGNPTASFVALQLEYQTPVDH